MEPPWACEPSKICPHAVTVSARKFLRPKLQPQAGLRARERRFDDLPDPRLPGLASSGRVRIVCSPTVAGAAPEWPSICMDARHRIPVSTIDRCRWSPWAGCMIVDRRWPCHGSRRARVLLPPHGLPRIHPALAPAVQSQHPARHLLLSGRRSGSCRNSGHDPDAWGCRGSTNRRRIRAVAPFLVAMSGFAHRGRPVLVRCPRENHEQACVRFGVERCAAPGGGGFRTRTAQTRRFAIEWLCWRHPLRRIGTRGLRGTGRGAVDGCPGTVIQNRETDTRSAPPPDCPHTPTDHATVGHGTRCHLHGHDG